MQRDKEREEEHLLKVLGEIERQIRSRKGTLESIKRAEIVARRAAWEELPRNVTSFEDLVELSQDRDRAKNAKTFYKISSRSLDRLKRALFSPYFARIDFQADGKKQPLRIYIGVSSVQEESSGEYLVYDWRAPVSSMFYDYEPGPAQYFSPAGTVSGNMLLKRQFKIENGALLYMFDSSVTIGDEVLQKALAESTDGHLRTIVYTIQREQNRIIRDEKHRVLLVQGPAGSGKTQIALHRAAYLLYKHRGTLNSDNIAIFSPNRVFADYISGVLPELGEYNVGQMTFGAYAKSILPEARRVEDANDQIEYLFSTNRGGSRDDRILGIRHKASKRFMDHLQEYVSKLQRTLPFRDITFSGQTIMSKEEQRALLTSEYTYLPFFRRLDKMRRRVLWLIEGKRKEREAQVKKELSKDPLYAGYYDSDLKSMSRQRVQEEIAPIRDYLSSLIPGTCLDIYKRFLREESHPFPVSWTFRTLDMGLIPYEDTGPLLLLKGMLEGFPERDIRHVIIDEAQDYTLVQYEAIRRSFPSASFTLLGDLQQIVNPYMNVGTYEDLRSLFNGEETASVTLRNTYRSTYNITRFCRGILPAPGDAQPMDRPGEMPQVILIKEGDDVADLLSRDIEKVGEKGLRSLAVICKTAAQSKDVHTMLKTRVKGLKLLSKSSRRFQSGLVILPAYLAKGLEFDAVMVYGADDSNYSEPGDEHLLYIACTRALHSLHLYARGKLSPFLPAPDPDLYILRWR